MSVPSAAAGRPTTIRTLSRAEARRRKVRRARNFFLIAVMASLVSLAGHCLAGDDAPVASRPATTDSIGGH